MRDEEHASGCRRRRGECCVEYVSWRSERLARIATLRLEGAGPEAIGREMGVTRERIRQLLKAQGLK